MNDGRYILMFVSLTKFCVDDRFLIVLVNFTDICFRLGTIYCLTCCVDAMSIDEDCRLMSFFIGLVVFLFS